MAWATPRPRPRLWTPLIGLWSRKGRASSKARGWGWGRVLIGLAGIRSLLAGSSGSDAGWAAEAAVRGRSKLQESELAGGQAAAALARLLVPFPSPLRVLSCSSAPRPLGYTRRWSRRSSFASRLCSGVVRARGHRAETEPAPHLWSRRPSRSAGQGLAACVLRLWAAGALGEARPRLERRGHHGAAALEAE